MQDPKYVEQLEAVVEKARHLANEITCRLSDPYCTDLLDVLKGETAELRAELLILDGFKKPQPPCDCDLVFECAACRSKA